MSAGNAMNRFPEDWYKAFTSVKCGNQLLERDLDAKVGRSLVGTCKKHEEERDMRQGAHHEALERLVQLIP
jgi:hypothetical protein